MTYQDLLLENEWSLKRLEILERDEFQCQRCFAGRPKFRGLVNSFGIVSYEELLKMGYSNLNFDKCTMHHNNLIFHKDGWANKVIYIGDETFHFDLQKLLFTLQSSEIKVFGFLKRAFRLICFYKEDFTGQTFIDLNIHHKFYITGHKPWEYENDTLVTLCASCHKLTHEETETVVFSKHGDKLFNTKICSKCEGAGYIEAYDYYKNGVCFQCWGEGVILSNDNNIN